MVSSDSAWPKVSNRARDNVDSAQAGGEQGLHPLRRDGSPISFRRHLPGPAILTIPVRG